VIKNKKIEWPRAETKEGWVAMGYDKNLNTALTIAVDQAIKLIQDKNHVSTPSAEKILREGWNCPISEVVNGVQGVYCIIPKDNHATAFPLPSNDNEKVFVTTGKDADLEKAMKKASMAMLTKLMQAKKMNSVDAYMLASFAMDCRISPYTQGDKEVHCMMPKNLWV